jgi:hypothetical protein
VRAVASATISRSEMTASRVALRSPHCDRLSALDARVEGLRVQQMIGRGGVGGCQQGSQPPNIQQVALDLEKQLLELGQVIHVSQTTSAGKSPAVQNCTLPRLRLGLSIGLSYGDGGEPGWEVERPMRADPPFANPMVSNSGSTLADVGCVNATLKKQRLDECHDVGA